MKKITVLIIEDSKVMQQLFTEILSSDPEIQVIGVVDDPLIARGLIKKMNPDVLTLDIMLPYMDGITFLKNLMRLQPMPVVMISALTEENSDVALEALANGAVDYLSKPLDTDLTDLSKYATKLTTAIKNAAKANVVKRGIMLPLRDEKLEKIIYQTDFLNKILIVIGASTGGIEAIEHILMRLPQVLPAIVIVQHIKKEFSSAFAKRIYKLFGMTVVKAENDTEVLPGHIYIPPGDHHLIIKKQNNQYIASLLNNTSTSYKPSIDILFHSVALAAENNCIGILLTGIGTDGAEGLKEIHNAGGKTIVQNEETSVVWGMAGAAVKMNVVDYIAPLDEISQKILEVIDVMIADQKQKTE